MKRKGIMWLILLCILVGMVPVNILASGAGRAEKSVSDIKVDFRVVYKGEVVPNTHIEARMVTESDEIVSELGSSDNGELNVTIDNEQWGFLEFVVDLPEGYEYGNENTFVRKWLRVTGDGLSEGGTNSYGYFSGSGTFNCEVTKPAEDGYLTGSYSQLYVVEGDVVDVSGALFSTSEGAFCLYQVMPDGTRTRVYADRMGLVEDNGVLEYDDGVIALKPGKAEIYFMYKGMKYVLPVTVFSKEDQEAMKEKSLTANVDHMTVKQGETLDLRGAWKEEYTDFQLFLVDKDGTRTRAYCDTVSHGPGFTVTGNPEGYLEYTAKEAGTSYLTFRVYYNEAYSWNFRLTVDVIEADGSNTETPTEIPGDTTTAPTEATETTETQSTASAFSQGELTYKAEDGRQVRQIVSAENASITVAGNPKVIQTGMTLKAAYTVGGDSYERAYTALQKRITGYEGFRVYDIDLWDAANQQIHQLGEYVNVTMPIPEGLSFGNGVVLAVYRVEEDGSLTHCQSAVKNGMLTFATNHFSTYIIVQNAVETSPKTGEEQGSFLGWLF